MPTLHLMTQRDQPYGSVRKCCEMCGLMLVARPDWFWNEHAWVDDPEHYKRHEGATFGEMVPCYPPAQPADSNSPEFEGISATTITQQQE